MEIIQENDSVIMQVPKKGRFFIGDKAFTPIDIIEVKKDLDDEFGCVRLYSCYVGDSTKNENQFKLQIRANQSLFGRQKKRNLIATVSLSDSEIITMAQYVIEKRKKHNTFHKIDL